MRYWLSVGISIVAALIFLGEPIGVAHATTLSIVTSNTRHLRLEQVANFSTPINDATSPTDNSNRLFVVQQNGSIRVIQNGVALGPAYLNLATFAGTNFGNFGGETGLLGLAFHPDFANPGTDGFKKFYTFSSQSKQGNADFFNDTAYPPSGGSETLTAGAGNFQNVVTEWTLSPAASLSDNVFTGTRRVVMSIAKQASNHNGGALAFGTAAGDRNNLYIALGDGGDGNDHGDDINGNPSFTSNIDGHTNSIGNAQDKNVVYGKILRINPTMDANPANNGANNQYDIPATNPFVGEAGLDEIIAYGFRNPFRMSFDPLTNLLYVGDVGQGLREEVDKIDVNAIIADTSTGNYGWVNKEGTAANPNSPSPPVPIVGADIDPFAEYTHPSGGAVIGGYVNRGTSLPDLFGYYIFGELSTKLFYTDPNDPTGKIFQFIIDTSTGGTTLNAGVNGFGRDQAGHIYALLSNGRVLLLPEPSTGLLAAVGIGLGLAFADRRKLCRAAA